MSIRAKLPLLRALTVIAAVVVVTTGVTFAIMQSQNATLAGNTINSATANLLIGATVDTAGATYGGFTFTNVEPGGPAVPAAGNLFYLKNTGTTDLDLKLRINSSQLSVSSNVDTSKVHIILTPVAGGTPVNIPLATIVSASPGGGVTLGLSLAAGAAAQYNLQVSMDAGAVTGVTSVAATISNMDLIFSGVTS